MTDLGKKGTIYVVRANGEVRKVRKCNANAINAGTEIFVVEGEKRVRNPQLAITAFSAIITAASTVVIMMNTTRNW